MSALLKKFSNLLCVKSIVTLVLTVVFAYLAVLDRISNQDFFNNFFSCHRILFRHTESAPE